MLLGGGLAVWAWPRAMPAAVLALHGLWVPQIVLQAVSGTRRGMQARYVVGMSLLRLALPLYYYACPTNFLSNQISPPLVAALVLWLAAQLAVLFLQDRWGPRFFVPARFLPPRYDYFRSVPLLSLGRSGGGGRRSGGRRAGPSVSASGADGGAGPDAKEDVSPEDAALSAVQLAVAGDSPAPALSPAAVATATTAATAAAAAHVSISMGEGAAPSALSPSALSDGEEDEDENPCPICYGELDAEGAGAGAIMVCPCDHMFHTRTYMHASPDNKLGTENQHALHPLCPVRTTRSLRYIGLTIVALCFSCACVMLVCQRVFVVGCARSRNVPCVARRCPSKKTTNRTRWNKTTTTTREQA